MENKQKKSYILNQHSFFSVKHFCFEMIVDLYTLARNTGYTPFLLSFLQWKYAKITANDHNQYIYADIIHLSAVD